MLQQKKVAGILGAMALMLSSLSASTEKPNGCTGPVLCPSFPIATRCADCCNTWHLSVSALVEQPGFADMSPGYGYTPTFQDPTGGEWTTWVNQNGEKLLATYDYTAGFAFELGHLMKHDNWYFGVTFDWLSAKISNLVYSDNNTLYRPSAEFAYQAMIWTNFDWRTDTFGKIGYSANSNIYNLGFMLSRGAYITDRFSFEPFGGVKALWFDNSQTKKYQEPSANASQQSRYNLVNYQENWGAGLMVGLNLKYTITSGISLFSDNNIGALYGQMSYKVTTTVTGGLNYTDGVDPRVQQSYVNNDTAMYVPVRSTLGVELSKYFNEENQFVAIRVGYDAQAVLSPSNRADLQMLWSIPTTSGDATIPAQPVAVMRNVNNGYFVSGLKIDVIIDF